MRDCRRTLSLALALVFAVASHSNAAEPGLYEAAKKEGEVVWYTSLIVNQAVRPLVEAFNKKYPGIAVKYARADSGPTAIKIMNEAQAGRPQSGVKPEGGGFKANVLSPDTITRNLDNWYKIKKELFN